MKIIDLKNNREVQSIGDPLCLLLGNFDGVHCGHIKLAKTAVSESGRLGIKSAAWTFADHPSTVLSGKKISYLTEAWEKNQVFASLGLDYVIYEDFSRVRSLSPEEFVEKELIGRFDCRMAVCGFNFRFGMEGKGTKELLCEMMEKRGRAATVVDPVYRLGRLVSSTEIRALIEEGKTEDAAELLGRPYSVTLPVVHGKELGRTLGMPTINQRFPEGRIIPKKGIYACICFAEGREYVGVANVGSRPTVNDDGRDINCETHIIGFEGWLYGKNVTVSFYKRLRDEKKFSDTAGLKAAVDNDIRAALDYFSKKQRN